MSKQEATSFLNQVFIGSSGKYNKFYYSSCLMKETETKYVYMNPFLGSFSKIEQFFMSEGENQVWKYSNGTSYLWYDAHKDYNWGLETYIFMMENNLQEKFWDEKERFIKNYYKPNWEGDMNYIINYKFHIKKQYWNDFVETVLLPVFMKIFIKV